MNKHAKFAAVFSLLLLVSLLSPRPGRAESPLSLVLENQTYFYDLEHSNIDHIDRGFTLIGDLFKPHFRYDIKPGLRIEAGALLDIPFGSDDRVDQVEPVISVHYGFAPHWLLTAGTLDRDHPLHDAFFDDVLHYTDPIEQGFQIKGAGRHFRQDTWIDWELNETADRREKFSVGNYSQVKWKGLMADAQVYWVHLGGQQNSQPCCFNNLSLGFGTGYTYRPKTKGGILDEIGFTVHYLYNADFPTDFPTAREDGIATKIFTRMWDVYFYALAWNGGSQDFNSAQGDSLRPGVPLAKGDPIYKADDFQEVGFIKTWRLADEVTLDLGARGQYIDDMVGGVFLFNFTWSPSIALFEDYFASRPARAR